MKNAADSKHFSEVEFLLLLWRGGIGIQMKTEQTAPEGTI